MGPFRSKKGGGPGGAYGSTVRVARELSVVGVGSFFRLSFFMMRGTGDRGPRAYSPFVSHRCCIDYLLEYFTNTFVLLPKKLNVSLLPRYKIVASRQEP